MFFGVVFVSFNCFSLLLLLLLLIRDGEEGRGGGMKVGREGDYIPIGTLSAPE